MSDNIFSYEYEDFNEKTGVLYETLENMKIRFVLSEDEGTLSANREGLIALAKSLIKLADEKVPAGSHFHLDSPLFLEKGSIELIIEKI